MKLGDLVKFQETGVLATIVEIKEAGVNNAYALLWVSGDVKFKNPTCMTLHMLKRTGEVISHAS